MYIIKCYIKTGIGILPIIFNNLFASCVLVNLLVNLLFFTYNKIS